MEEMRLQGNLRRNVAEPFGARDAAVKIESSVLPDVVRRRAEKLAEYCRNFRSREIKEDRFGTDAAGRLEERKQRYAQVDSRTITADERNKLRRSNIMPVLSGFESLMDAFDKTGATGTLSERVHSLSKELPDPYRFAGKQYDSMSFEEKRGLAERIDRIAQSFLDIMRGSNLH